MEEPSEPLKWYYKPGMVVVLLFLVLGPFGLPILYKSPKFNKPWKILLTILMIPYTWYMGVLTVKSIRETSQRVSEMQELIGK